MPGEPLMCVWETAWAEDSNESTAPPTELLKSITTRIAKNHPQSLQYKEGKFSQTFTQETIDFDEFKKYFAENLKVLGVPLCEVLLEIEDYCWETCKQTYPLKATNCPEYVLKYLWQIFIRMTKTGTYPPKIEPVDVQWVFDKLTAAMQKYVVFRKIKAATDRSYTFCELYLTLIDYYFKYAGNDDVESVITDIHDWLVKEVCMVGWLYKRTRKQANWTNWVKRWFILYPGKLVYYASPACKEKKGEVLITSWSKVDETEGRKGSFIGRSFAHGFRVTNQPYLEIDMCAPNHPEKVAWMASIKEVIETKSLGLTPVQALLKERSIYSTSPNKKVLAAAEDRLSSFRMTARRTRDAMENNKKADKKNQKGVIKLPQPDLVTIEEGVSNASLSDGKDTSDEEIFDNSLFIQQRDKIKAVFSQIDKDGNGYVDKSEFREFYRKLGMTELNDREIDLVFETADKSKTGKLKLDNFTDYFVKFVMDDESANENLERKMRAAFLKADLDGTGTVDFREFTEFAWARKRSVTVSMLMKAFKNMDQSNKGEISYNDFREFFKNDKEMDRLLKGDDSETSKPVSESSLEKYLRQKYNDTDVNDLAQYLRSRWDAFASFKRYGTSGELVMTGGSGMVADIVPGKYNLVDLACFSDLPPLKPKYKSVKNTKWIKSVISGKSGKLVFPSSFDPTIPVDIATTEHLRYYSCSLADSNQVQVSLLYRHGIQDFTYQNKYLEDYVTSKNGGAGLERHDFSHLDCPLEEDSGHFIIAKYNQDSDEFHITAFKVPMRHTLYVPGETIHCNDYLKGTWRTMLSDEAEIDHVHLTRRKSSTISDDEMEHIQFTFDK